LSRSSDETTTPDFSHRRGGRRVDAARFSCAVDAGYLGVHHLAAVDSQGTIYYSIKSGDIVRAGAMPVVVAHVPTVANGNSGLIGLALRDDHTAIVHYTTPRQTYDVVSAVDLDTGMETEIHRFATDRDFPERGASTEHHGGNLTIAPDGSIFLAIGDYGVGIIAAELDWNGGKVWRIDPDGTAVQFAHGFRNPFDSGLGRGGRSGSSSPTTATSSMTRSTS